MHAAPVIGSSIDANAPPRDLDPAVARALPDLGLAIEEALEDPATGFRYLGLIDTKDQPGWIRAHFDPPPPGTGAWATPRTSVPVQITVRLGHLGDPAREAALLRAIERHLADLRERP